MSTDALLAWTVVLIIVLITFAVAIACVLRARWKGTWLKRSFQLLLLLVACAAFGALANNTLREVKLRGEFEEVRVIYAKYRMVENVERWGPFTTYHSLNAMTKNDEGEEIVQGGRSVWIPATALYIGALAVVPTVVLALVLWGVAALMGWGRRSAGKAPGLPDQAPSE